MCGIAGIWGRLGETSDLKVLSEKLSHRGPDDEGYVIIQDGQAQAHFGHSTPQASKSGTAPYLPKSPLESVEYFDLAFVHRRLSIIDLTANGHQPMSDATGRFWIAYNGEVYNYQGIRDILAAKGHTFYSNTDTEVVLHAYMEWGVDCLDRFDGMWAFAIADIETGDVFLARDRTGVKPFYYCSKQSGFAFASELKALVACQFYHPQLNHGAVGDFMGHGLLEREGKSLFEGINELQPGHYITGNYKAGTFRTERYFNYRKDQSREKKGTEPGPESEAIRELMLHAVESRLGSDVKVGCCLSGGLDSSSIAGMIHYHLGIRDYQQVGSNLSVFTSCSSDPKFDEQQWAEQVVNHTGAEWHKVFPTSDELWKDINDMVYTQDLPLLSTSTYAQYRVMQKVAESGVKVVLDGQGGDELFAGYPHYYTGWFRDRFTKTQWGDLKAYDPDLSILPSKSYPVKTWLKSQFIPSLGEMSKPMMNKYHQEWKYVNQEILAIAPSLPSTPQTLNGQLAHDYYNGPLKSLLRCEDRNSMRFSVESRTPFADDRALADYVHGLEGRWKMKQGQPKALLRMAMKRLVPQSVLDRRDKMGYMTPNDIWISELSDQIRDLIASDKSGVIQVKELLKDFDEFFRKPNPQENFRVFKFVSFAIWYRTFFQSETP